MFLPIDDESSVRPPKGQFPTLTQVGRPNSSGNEKLKIPQIFFQPGGGRRRVKPTPGQRGWGTPGIWRGGPREPKNKGAKIKAPVNPPLMVQSSSQLGISRSLFSPRRRDPSPSFNRPPFAERIVLRTNRGLGNFQPASFFFPASCPDPPPSCEGDRLRKSFLLPMRIFLIPEN